MDKKRVSLYRSFVFAFHGLKLAWQERNVRVHLLAAVAVSAAGYGFHITQAEWLACLLLFALMISLEIVNTAIEQLVDMVQPEWHEQAGKIKDLSAGAVLWSGILAVIAGIVIFGKYIVALL